MYVHLDGAQSWGIAELDLHDLGCDSYSASSHKWFCGPREVGLLYVRKERIAEIWPRIVAPGWGTTAETVLKGARKFENFGQRDDSRLTAIATTVEFHNTLGAAATEARVYRLATALKEGLKDAGAKLVTPMDSKVSSGVCIIEVPAENPRQGQRRDVSQARDCVLEHGRPAAVSAPLQHHRTRLSARSPASRPCGRC